MRQEREDFGPDDALPIQLQIRVLRAKLERIELDLDRLDEAKAQLVEEIDHYESLLAQTRRSHVLRRVK